MTFRVRKGSAYKTVPTSAPSKMHIWKGGAYHDIQRMWIWKTINGQAGWRKFWEVGGATPTPTPSPTPSPSPSPTTLRVNIQPTEISGTKTGAGTVTTAEATATASRGTPPYTYKWTLVTWDAPQAPTILGTLTNKAKGQLDLPNNAYATARFRCTAKDSVGNKGSATVEVKFYTGTGVGNTSVNWPDIAASSPTHVVTTTGLAQTMPASGTLNFTGLGIGHVIKNGADIGAVASVVVAAGDTIAFRFTLSGNGLFYEATVNVTGLVSDTFDVSLTTG